MTDSNQDQQKTFMDIFNDMLIQRYGRKIVELGSEPKNYHALGDANGHVSYTGPCGDTMEIWVKITEDVIQDISFRTNGCDCTRAVGSVLTEMAKGISIQKALEITPQDIDDALDGLPDDHKHCAILARDALHKAIKNYSDRSA
jgi:nitrogen fixation NifU-like protein